MGIGLIGAIIVGGFAGWIASRIMRVKTGVLANIGLGILGAFVMNALLEALGIYAEDDWLPQLVVALTGACLLIGGWRKLKG